MMDTEAIGNRIFPNRDLDPPWWLYTTLVGLIWSYLVAQTVGSAALVNQVNLWGPLSLGIAGFVVAFQLIRRFSEAIWTPYAWFLMAIVLFYSVGPLIYSLAGLRTLAYVMSFLPITPEQLLRTNLLDAVGVLSVLLGFRLAQPFASSPRRAPVRGLQQIASNPRAVALAFLLVGGVLEYLLILPYRLGLTRQILPGILNNLGNLYLLGLMVLAYVVARGDRPWRLLFFLLWFVQVIVSFLMFSKLQLVFSLVFPALGSYLGDRRIMRLVLFGLLVAVVYFSVSPLVSWGRQQIANQTGNINHASLTSRAYIVGRWVEEGRPTLNHQGTAAGAGWRRLNYASVQAFAMSRYDQGAPGHTLRYAGIVLVPRFLWPDKPITTNMAVDFYQLVAGQRGSHLGLGIFGEGYWDYGWPGVIGLGLVAGVIFSLLSSLSLVWMRRRAFEYLPSVFLGIQMGVIGTTALFVNSVMGSTGMFFAYALAAWFVVRLLVRKPSLAPAARGVGRL